MPHSSTVLRSAFALLLLFAVRAMTTCTALAQPVAAAQRPIGVWATAGAGTMTDGSTSKLSDALGFHVQRGPLTASARRHTVALVRGSRLEAISVLAGRARQSPGVLGAAISAGITHMHERGYFDLVQGAERNAVGATIVGDVSLRRGDGGLGIGLSMFATQNSVHSVRGLQVEILAGRWR